MGDKKPYGGAVTREQFLFYETRITASLMCEGLSDTEIIERVADDNLFQFPTERMIKNIAAVCCKRLHYLEDEDLIRAIAYEPAEEAKQICLYAMMLQYGLVRDFMVNVIGEKFNNMDFSFGNIDINSFFMELQQTNDEVAEWKDSTIKKLSQVLRKLLIENDYLDDVKSSKLNPVLIGSTLENSIRSEGNLEMLCAFNCQI